MAKDPINRIMPRSLNVSSVDQIIALKVDFGMDDGRGRGWMRWFLWLSGAAGRMRS